jgi:hypothetical protein
MQPHIINTGIDTVKVNVKRLNPDDQQPLKAQAVPEWLVTLLEQWQAYAKECGEPVKTSMTLDNDRLKMLPNGASAWKYVLRNGAIELKICPRLELAMVAKVTFQSAYLWKVGVQDALDEVHSFLIDLLNEQVMLQAAQIDLCVDVVGLHWPTEWERVFVGHALRKRPIGPSQKDQAIYNGRRLETIMFSGHGCPVSCKVYDKWVEIRRHRDEKAWFYKLWRDQGWDEEWCKKAKETVRRVEFSVEREGLRDMELEDIYDALRNVKRLWTYCTYDWLRMVKPVQGDTNRTRWPTHSTWTMIQHAFDGDGCKMAEALGPLVRIKRRKANIERAIAAISGYITTFAAWDEEELSETDDAETIFKVLYARVLKRWGKQGIVVQDVVREKKFLYHLKG